MKKESKEALLKLFNGNKRVVDMINQWFLYRRRKPIDYILVKKYGVILYYAREISLFNYEVIKETFCIFYNDNKKNKEIFFNTKNKKGV